KQWETWSREKFYDGQYEKVITSDLPSQYIAILADGYVPAISPLYSDDEDHIFDVKLVKGKGPNGSIHLPYDVLATGADVILCSESRGLRVRNGASVSYWNHSPIFYTIYDGSFSF